MKTVNVSVKFSGEVTVQIPEGLSKREEAILAKQKALCMVQAVTENDSAPEFEACEELEDKLNLDEDAVGELWDKTEVVGVGGVWK